MLVLDPRRVLGVGELPRQLTSDIAVQKVLQMNMRIGVVRLVLVRKFTETSLPTTVRKWATILLDENVRPVHFSMLYPRAIGRQSVVSPVPHNEVCLVLNSHFALSNQDLEMDESRCAGNYDDLSPTGHVPYGFAIVRLKLACALRPQP